MASKGARERAAERRVQALELRKAGATYRQIGAMLGVSGVQAYRDVARALEALAVEEHSRADELRALEDARLDDILIVLWPRVKHGDIEAITTTLRLMERRAKLWGLDSPGEQRVDVGGALVEVLARLADSGGSTDD